MKKTNKTFKRFAAITSASLLAACAVAPAVSYAQKVNISLGEGVFNGDTIEHKFNYVQILKGESETKNTGIELKNPSWNTDNIDVAGLITALANDTKFNDALGQNPFKDADGAITDMSATVFADKIKDFGEDTEKSQALAKAIVANVKTGVATEYSEETGITVDGYYLITDETDVSGVYNSKGRYILTTIDGDSTTDISAKLKASAPEVIKKVKENADTDIADFENETTLEGKVNVNDKWNDVADYTIGDSVPFMLYGSMPSSLGDYDAYFYRFNDTLGDKFNQPEKVTVKLENETIEFTLSEVEKEVGGVVTKVKEYTTPTDKNCRVKYENYKLTVTFEDVTAYENVDYETVVTVYYEAVLNENANIGIPGQVNKVDLSYSNNPTFEYSPNTGDDIDDTDDTVNENLEENTGTTVEDKAIVFTYEADISKYNTAGDSLAGAEFYLSRTVKNELQEDVTEYVIVDATSKKVTGWTTTKTSATKFTSTASVASIKIKGLDAGKYILTEEKAPEGYKLPEDNEFEFTITATTDNTQSWTGATETDGKTGSSVLTGIDVSVDSSNLLISKDEGNSNAVITRNEETEAIESFTWKVENGAVGVAITNTSGSTLPGTGGIGTTIFYLGGGAMAAIGGVYLISKRRMKKSEE